METTLRKVGKSVGVIIPKAILDELRLSIGVLFDVSVQGGQIVLAPVPHSPLMREE